MRIEIRPPREEEWPACRMLVPEPFEKGIRPQAFLAFDSTSPQLLGAAAFQIAKQEVSLFRIRVVRTHRRTGIGSRLLGEVLAVGRAAGKFRISTLIDTVGNPDAAPFLSSAGFRSVTRILTLEVDLPPMREDMTRLRERILRSGRVPASVRVVSLADAPTIEVAKLYGDYILTQHRGNPAFVGANLDAEDFDQPTSVLIADEKVVAIVVVRYEMDDHRAVVPARVVLPEYRGGWANVLIMADALDKGAANGISRVRFDSLEDNQDTLRLGRRFNADTVHNHERFVRSTSDA